MAEREPVMEKRVVRLPDGRRLVYYEFPEALPRSDAPAPPPARRPGPGER